MGAERFAESDLLQRLQQHLTSHGLMPGVPGSPPQQAQLNDLGLDCRPALHERQIADHEDPPPSRAQRVDDHAHRIKKHLMRHPTDDEASSHWRRGKARPVWCVEQRRVFASVGRAARSVNRSPSNILQSIQRGYRCGDFHWSYEVPLDATSTNGPAHLEQASMPATSAIGAAGSRAINEADRAITCVLSETRR